MTDYRLYSFNEAGHIGDGEWIAAHNDDEGIALVRSKKLTVDSELWLGIRLVSRIPRQLATALRPL